MCTCMLKGCVLCVNFVFVIYLIIVNCAFNVCLLCVCVCILCLLYVHECTRVLEVEVYIHRLSVIFRAI